MSIIVRMHRTGRRRSQETPALSLRKDQPGAAAEVTERRHLHRTLRDRRDRPRPVPPCLLARAGGAGLQASQEFVSQRPFPSLDQGQEPEASRLQARPRSDRLGRGAITIKDVWLFTGSSQVIPRFSPGCSLPFRRPRRPAGMASATPRGVRRGAERRGLPPGEVPRRHWRARITQIWWYGTARSTYGAH